MDEQLIVQSSVGPVCTRFSAAEFSDSFLFQVQGDQGSRVRKPRVTNNVTFRVAPKKVSARNKKIKSGLRTSDLFISTKKPSNKDRKATKTSHCVHRVSWLSIWEQSQFPQEAACSRPPSKCTLHCTLGAPKSSGSYKGRASVWPVFGSCCFTWAQRAPDNERESSVKFILYRRINKSELYKSALFRLCSISFFCCLLLDSFDIFIVYANLWVGLST